MTAGGAGFEVVRATSLVVLADHLADRLRTEPPADPFTRVEVAVPSRGTERWLAQRLSGVLGATATEAGVCANVAFPFLGGTIQRVVAASLGEDRDAPDPWAPDRLAWPLLAELDALLADPADPVLAPLRSHLTEDGRPAPRRRLPLARRIADLFDRYALYRPEMVAAWRDGRGVDGEGAPLPPQLAWQPELWRRVQTRLGRPSPDQRLRTAIDRLRDGTAVGPLPPVTVFGVLAIPPLHLELLAALGGQVPVTLYAVTPCPAWGPDEPRPVPVHPLLLADGTRARDAHTVLAPYLSSREVLDPDAADDPDPRSVLAQLQADIRADRRRGGPAGAPTVPRHPEDRSVQVHTAHGLLRQLEVLREVLHGLLEDDPSLEPRDILVLTPDVDAVAPLLPAAFPTVTVPSVAGSEVAGSEVVGSEVVGSEVAGSEAAGWDAAGAAGPPPLPIRVADRTLGRDSAVAHALLAVLDLVTSRVTATQVLDLLAETPVRARFGLTAADLELLPSWLRDSGIRWGRDAQHRAELLGLDDDAHTWSAGLDRWTVGAAMADDGDRLVAGVRPFDEVEGDRVDVLGRVLAATDALFAALDALRAPRPLDAWHRALCEVLVALLDPGPGPARDAALADDLTAVRAALEEIAERARGVPGAPSEVPVTLEELRGLLTDHLGASDAPPATATGAITVTGFVPLRNLPHRVVCLVGMDDGAWPRSTSTVGFDLLEIPRRPGDPDTRLEDRQQLLDAILAARDHLVVTATGQDPRSNEERQPAVPVSELLDVLAVTVDDADALLTSHPLQPHSARYYRAARPGEPALPRAFDRAHLAAARAAQHARGRAAPFVSGPLPAPPAELLPVEAVELDDLVDFLQHPVRFLLRRRLGLGLGRDDPRLDDRDPLELDGLERWALGDTLLERRLAGRPVTGWRTTALAAGTAPAGALGGVVLDGIEGLVDALADQVAELAPGEPQVVPIDLRLPAVPGSSAVDGHRLVGTVTRQGDRVVHLGAGKVRAKHRLAAWVRLLSLAAAGPDLAPTAVLLGRGKRDDAASPVRLDPAGVEAATTLATLVDLFERGHRELLPILPDSAAVYAAERGGGADHDLAIRTAHTKGWTSYLAALGDGRDPYVVQALGPDTDLAEVAARHPFADEAELVWAPLLAAEVV